MGDNKIKEPPHSEDAEQMVLGSILIDDKLMKDCIDEMEPRDFYFEMNRDIYKAMKYLHYNQKTIDYSNVIDRLQYKDSKNKKVAEYILGLSDSVPSTVNFQSYIDRVLDLSQKREFFRIGEYFTSNEISGVATENLISMVEEAVSNINTVSNLEVDNLKSYAEQWYDMFKSKEKPKSILFGFKELDKKIMFESGNLGIIGARPGVGKSALALNYALNFARQGKSVIFVTLEMSKKEVMDRLTANLSKVEHEKIKRKMDLERHEKEKIKKAIEYIETLDFFVYDRGGMTPDHLSNMTKKIKKKSGVDAVIVDYLQLMDSGKKNLSGVQEVTYISRKLKQMGQELDIQVLALSQLSRKSVGQDGKPREPQLSDLRESGSIEQDANFVIMMHSEDEEDKFSEHKYVKLFIRKNRSGTMGTVNYTYYGDFFEYEEKFFNPETGKFEVVEQLNLDKFDKVDINDEDLPF